MNALPEQRPATAGDSAVIAEPDTALTAGATPERPPLFSGRLSDWVLFALALLSIAMLAWQNFWHVEGEQLFWIRAIDYGVCAIFAAEFFLHWRQDGWTLRYLGRNWYAFLGMIPVSHSLLHHHPWIRLLLTLARVARAVDRILGEGFVMRLLTRIKDLAIGAVSGAITVAVLNEVANVLVKGTYTRNISQALAENETELRAMVLEKLRNDPQTGKLRWLPYHDAIVDSVITAVLRVTEGILNDPRTDELVADMLRENIAQLRLAVEQAQTDKKA